MTLTLISIRIFRNIKYLINAKTQSILKNTARVESPKQCAEFKTNKKRVYLVHKTLHSSYHVSNIRKIIFLTERRPALSLLGHYLNDVQL